MRLLPDESVVTLDAYPEGDVPIPLIDDLDQDRGRVTFAAR